MSQFESPHPILDGHVSLCRHHYAKQSIREQQLLDLPTLSPKAEVLDVGVGPGLYLDFWMRQPGTQQWNFHLLDHSKELLEHCLKTATRAGAKKRTHLYVEDMYQLKRLGTERFDLIFIGNTFEYFRDPEEYIQSQVLPLLKPGGRLAVRDLDCGILTSSHVDPALVARVITARILGCQSISKPGMETFHNPYIGRELGGQFLRSGLKNVEMKTYYCEFRGPLNSHQQQYLSKIHTTWYVEDRTQYLTASERSQWKRLFDLQSPECILKKPDYFYVESEFMSVGTKGA